MNNHQPSANAQKKRAIDDQKNKEPNAVDHKKQKVVSNVEEKGKNRKVFKKSSDNLVAIDIETFDSNLELSTNSGSEGSVGSVLSLSEIDKSDIIEIDFECRLIPDDQALIRRNKTVSYRQLFKRPTSANKGPSMQKDDLIGKQYKINKLMGKGTFSHVYLCKDIFKNQEMALKAFVMRNQSSIAKGEYLIAQHLKSLDPTDKYRFVKMLDIFRIRNQFFIVYEWLGLSIYDYMSKVRKKNYTVKEILEISKQCVACLDFLHKNFIIHTDIKPENILFMDPIDSSNQLSSTRVKIIDFGSSIMNSDSSARHYGTVTTRHYRAPEIVLHCNFSYPIDVWSFGITLFEMYTQILLFPSVISNLEHITIMTFTLGQLPNCLQNAKPDTFKRINALDKQEAKKKYKVFEKYFNENDKDAVQMSKFIKRMLIYDPRKRPTFAQLLSDPFIANSNS